jgi:hypothetical protein
MKTNQKIKETPPETSEPIAIDIFREPTREEVVAAFESVTSSFFDESQRDFQLRDHWEEHCLRHLLTSYLNQSPR